MKREYIVTWRIELTAESPHDAVQIARRIQLDPESSATIYEVAIDVDASEVNHDPQ
jgi:hypothetical protein